MSSSDQSRRPLKSLSDVYKNDHVVELIARSFCSETIKNHLKSSNVHDASMHIDLKKQPGITLKVVKSCGVAKLNFPEDKNAVNIFVKTWIRGNQVFDITSGC